MSNLLLTDFNNLMFQSIAVHQNFTYEDKFTGGVYGFLIQLCKLIGTYKPKNVVICNDKKPYIRSKLFPEYKAGRNSTEDESFFFKISQSKQHIRNLCSVLEIPIWESVGAEADDLIANIVHQYHDKYEKIIIKSNDDDLKQLLIFDNVFFFKTKELYGRKEFLKEYPTATPEIWIKMQALAGTHNAVPGIKGVGLKTALKIVSDPMKFRKVLVEHEEMYGRNMELIKLPHPSLVIQNSPPIQPLKINQRNLNKFLTTLGIEFTSYMSRQLEQ